MITLSYCTWRSCTWELCVCCSLSMTICLLSNILSEQCAYSLLFSEGIIPQGNKKLCIWFRLPVTILPLSSPQYKEVLYTSAVCPVSLLDVYSSEGLQLESSICPPHQSVSTLCSRRHGVVCLGPLRRQLLYILPTTLSSTWRITKKIWKPSLLALSFASLWWQHWLCSECQGASFWK